jgi:hypothetical protein
VLPGHGCCTPEVTVVDVQRRGGMIIRGESKKMEENLQQFHFIHRQSHMNPAGIESDAPQ